MQARYSGLGLTRMIMSGDLPPPPLMNLFGARWISADEGTSHVVVPASEWFCSSSRNVETAAIESLLNMGLTTASVTLWAPGQSIAGLEQNTHFFRPVSADGRDLTTRGRVAHRAGNLIFAQAEAIDADGNTLAGIALHVAARIVGLAGPSEIRVSQTVRDLAAGSGLRFGHRRAHSLKGVEGEWNLFAVES